MEPKAYTAVPALLQCLKDKNEGVRLVAVRSLGLIKEDAPIVVPAIVRCFEEETNYYPIRLDYFRAFENFGTNAKPAVPILIKIIESHKMDYMGYPALHALNKIDPETAKPFIEKWKASVSNAFSANPPPTQQNNFKQP